MFKILIIENDLFSSYSIARFLIHQEFHVILADSSLTGLQLAHELQPDLIISALYFPEIQGLELLKLLRKNSKTFQIPFIFLADHQNPEVCLQALRLGADDFLTKPLNVWQILQVIHTHLNCSKTNACYLYEKCF